MNNVRKVIIKNAFLAENCDLFVEYRCLDTKTDGKWQFKKEDFYYRPGLSIIEEMEKLRDAWNMLGGKIINVMIDENDEIYYSKKNSSGFIDLDSEMSNGDFSPQAANDFEKSFQYSDLEDSFVDMIQSNYDNQNDFVQEYNSVYKKNLEIDFNDTSKNEKEELDESNKKDQKNQWYVKKKFYF